MTSFLFHPVTTFIGGAIIALLVLGLFLNSKTEADQTAQLV
ncbi:MAG: hypothetical protein ACJA16_003185, partial [Akkermansiaceae bacterium]